MRLFARPAALAIALSLAAAASAGTRISTNPAKLTVLFSPLRVFSTVRAEIPLRRSVSTTIERYAVYLDDDGRVWLAIEQTSIWSSRVEASLVEAGPGKGKAEFHGPSLGSILPKLKNPSRVALDLKCGKEKELCGYSASRGYFFALEAREGSPVVLEYADLGPLQRAMATGDPSLLPAGLAFPPRLAIALGFDRALRRTLSAVRTAAEVDGVLAVTRAAGIDVVRLLEAKNDAGQIPWQEATAAGRPAIAEALARAGAKPCLFDRAAAADAARRGDSVCLQSMIDGGMSPDLTDAQGLTLLTHAILNERWRTAALLKHRGAQLLFAGDPRMRVPLVDAFGTAVRRGKYAVAGEMLGVDPDLVNLCVVRSFMTTCPLDMAAEREDAGMFTLLLAAPVNPGRATGHKNYLALAAKNDWLEVARMLLARGFADEVTVQGKRALDFAHTDAMRALLSSHGAVKGPGMPSLEEALTRLLAPVGRAFAKAAEGHSHVIVLISDFEMGSSTAEDAEVAVDFKPLNDKAERKGPFALRVRVGLGLTDALTRSSRGEGDDGVLLPIGSEWEVTLPRHTLSRFVVPARTVYIRENASTVDIWDH